MDIKALTIIDFETASDDTFRSAIGLHLIGMLVSSDGLRFTVFADSLFTPGTRFTIIGVVFPRNAKYLFLGTQRFTLVRVPGCASIMGLRSREDYGMVNFIEEYKASKPNVATKASFKSRA